MEMRVEVLTRDETIDEINGTIESIIMDAKGGVISWRDAEQKILPFVAFVEGVAGYERLADYVAERYLLANVEAAYERVFTGNPLAKWVN